MLFPWMMYRKGPGLDLPRGQRVSCQAAHDEAEYRAALKAGWFPSVPEALAEATLDVGPVAVPAPEIPPVNESGEAEPKGGRAPFTPEVDESSYRRGPGRPRRS